MAVEAIQGIVLTTDHPTQLDEDIDEGAESLAVVAQAVGTIIVGSAAITGATGCRFPVVAGTVLSFDLRNGHPYALAGTGTLTVDVLADGPVA